MIGTVRLIGNYDRYDYTLVKREREREEMNGRDKDEVEKRGN